MNHLYGDLCIYTLYICIYIHRAFSHVREVCLHSLHIISMYTCLEALNSSFGWWAFVLDVSVVDSFSFVWWRLDSTWMSLKISWLNLIKPIQPPSLFHLVIGFSNRFKDGFYVYIYIHIIGPLIVVGFFSPNNTISKGVPGYKHGGPAMPGVPFPWVSPRTKA